MPTPTNERIAHEVRDGVLVVTVKSSHIQDEQTAAGVLRELNAAVEAAGTHHIVIDMQRIRFMSSVAFGPFLSLRRRVQEAGGRLIICGLTPAVGDIFYTTKLIDPTGTVAAPFEMDEDVSRALARMNATRPKP